MIGLIWNLYFLVLLEITLGSAAGVEKRAGNCHQALVGGSSLPSPHAPAVEPTRVHINDQQISISEITDHKWIQSILATIFLFGTRVNEILNKTFILDSHRPFIFSVYIP
jgi:hypothetical protein